MKTTQNLCHIDMEGSLKKLKSKIDSVWGKNLAYHIFNVGEENYQTVYEDLASHLGDIRVCHSVNDKTTNFSKSRDIKYDPKSYHYFSSNTRQPLHTDYAYYEESESPDWIMLYCMEVSEYGGKTHMLFLSTLIGILEKYNPELLKKINIDVNWEYTGLDGDKVHVKPILNKGRINWNYWQIKEERNTEEVMNVRQEFFDFLENVIVAGGIYDFSKKWNKGDCLILNDHSTLHARSAFLGNERWLKDHAFYGK